MCGWGLTFEFARFQTLVLRAYAPQEGAADSIEPCLAAVTAAALCLTGLVLRGRRFLCGLLYVRILVSDKILQIFVDCWQILADYGRFFALI